MRSARWRSAGTNTRAAAGCRPSADCAPADCARRRVRTTRGSRFQASAENFSDAARPSSRSSARGETAASCPMVCTSIAASRALVAGPTPHISSTGSACRKFSSRAGSTTTSPSGFATCEAILARCLVRATPTEIGSPSSARTRRRIVGGDRGRRPEQMRGAGDVGEGLVDRDPLDQRRKIAEHPHRRIAEPLILGKMPADEDQLGTQLARRPPRHAAAHAERLRLIRRREHDPAADRDRPAAQRRVQQLLDRGVERVEVRMEDGGFHCGAPRERPRCRSRVIRSRRSGRPADKNRTRT